MNKIEREFRENIEEKAEAGQLPDGLSGGQVDTDVLYSEAAASWGDSDAPVTIVEFSDFECPFCARFANVVNELKGHYEPSELRVVFRHFPLSMHPRAREAAKAAACAQELGSFWEYHDLLFSNQGRFSDDQLRAYAEESGLDGVGLLNCMDSDFAEQRVSQDRQAGQQLGVQGTPSIYINGRPYEGPIDVRNMRLLVDNLLESAGPSDSGRTGDATDD
jgi:protein-disulfide isomerase